MQHTGYHLDAENEHGDLAVHAWIMSRALEVLLLSVFHVRVVVDAPCMWLGLHHVFALIFIAAFNTLVGHAVCDGCG